METNRDHSHHHMLPFYLTVTPKPGRVPNRPFPSPVLSLAKLQCGKHKYWRHTSVMSGETVTAIWFSKYVRWIKRCFSPLMSLLFSSDLNMTSNELSFWSSPWSILMAARPTPWALCLLTGNAALQSRTERDLSLCGKIQLNFPMMREGYKHNLFARTAVY